LLGYVHFHQSEWKDNLQSEKNDDKGETYAKITTNQFDWTVLILSQAAELKSCAAQTPITDKTNTSIGYKYSENI
jgi:hypothetical protein